MKKKILLLIVTLLLIPLGAVAQEAYAVLSKDKTTLSFYYDGKKSSREGTVYGLDIAGWRIYFESITKVIFDASFANARPTTTHRWFYECEKLKEIKGIHNLNTGNVTDMSYMFYKCSDLSTLDVSNFNTANVTNMSCMFYECCGLSSLDVSNFNTGNVTNMSRMFYNCSGLSTLDVSNFNTANVTNMSEMFYSCSGLSTLDVSNFNTANVTDMSSMFYRCSGLSTLDVSNFNTGNVTNMFNLFNGCSGLTTLDVSNFNTANVTNMCQLFVRCSGLSTLDVSNFNTGNVTNMKGMFWGCSGLTTLDVSNFNTANVTGMSHLFSGCSALSTLDVSKFNTDKVTYMSNMFDGCSGLTTLDVSNFNTDKVTHIGGMFFGCSGLTTLDLSNFNTDNVTSMGNLFSGCSGLTTLDLSNFNTDKVTYMVGMFEGCSGLTTIYCGDNWNTDKVTSSTSMFSGCTNLIGGAGTKYDSSHTDKAYAHVDGGKSNPGYLTYKGENGEPEAYAVFNDGPLTFYYDNQKSLRSGTKYELNTGKNVPGWYSDNVAITKAIFDSSFADARPTSTCYWFCGQGNMKSIDGINNLNTSKVTDMSYMFFYCESLLSIDVSGFDTGMVEDMSFMFSCCSRLTSLDLSNFNTSNVKNMSFMFGYLYEGTPLGCSGLMNLDISNFDTSNVTNMCLMFCGCSGLVSLNLDKIDTRNVKNMSGMFAGCSSLTSLDVSNFNTTKVTSMNTMFWGCRNLTSLDVSGFDTGSVTNMSYMFQDCSSLSSIDVSNFSTGSVTNMRLMFSGCSNLTTIDLCMFDTGNVTDMRSMFYNCSGLKTIICGDNWITDYIKYSTNMFSNCTNLVGGDGTVYDANYTDASKAYAGIGGYLTMKGDDGDDLQRYLDSLVDTEDELTNNVYRRVFLNDDWQALYVPFEMNYSDWADKFEVADIYGFYWYDDDDDNYVDRQELVATIVESGSLQANFPYLIRAKSKMGGTLSVNVSGSVSQKVTVAYMEIPPVTYSFVGNYTQLTGLMSAGRYRLQGGSLFIPLSDSEVLLPYRWYMTMDVASTQSVRLNIVTNDETTGIENVKKSQWMIHSTQQSTQQLTVFDLSGRRVDADIKSLPKGIYLINGKKQIIK